MTALSIVIPAYNEAERLPPTLTSIVLYLRSRAADFEVLVVDDGSTDSTFETALGQKFAEVRVIRCTKNRGKGHAVRKGMLLSRGRVRVFVDADGSTPIEELPQLLDALHQGADIAVGSRYVGDAKPNGQPWWRVALSRMANIWVRHTLIPGVRDPQCGFKAFTAAAAHQLFHDSLVDGWSFDLEVLALASVKGFRIAEIPVVWNDDARSKVQAWRDIRPALMAARSIAHRVRQERERAARVELRAQAMKRFANGSVWGESYTLLLSNALDPWKNHSQTCEREIAIARNCGQVALSCGRRHVSLHG